MDLIKSEIKVFQNNPFQTFIQVLLIAGAINWGLIAYQGTDYVRLLAYTVSYPKLDTYIKLAVGLAGIFMLYKLLLRSFQSVRDFNTKIITQVRRII